MIPVIRNRPNGRANTRPFRRNFPVLSPDLPRYLLPTSPEYHGVFWQANLGYREYGTWLTIRNWWSLTNPDKRPSMSKLAATMGCDRSFFLRLLPDLADDFLLTFTNTGTATAARCRITAVAHDLPWLTPNQVGGLPKTLQKEHQTYIEKFGIDNGRVWSLRLEESFLVRIG